MKQDLNQFLDERAHRRTGNLPLAIGLSLGLHAAVAALFLAAASRGAALPPAPAPKSGEPPAQTPERPAAAAGSEAGSTAPGDARPGPPVALAAQAPQPPPAPEAAARAPENRGRLRRARLLPRLRKPRGAKP